MKNHKMRLALAGVAAAALMVGVEAWRVGDASAQTANQYITPQAPAIGTPLNITNNVAAQTVTGTFGTAQFLSGVIITNTDTAVHNLTFYVCNGTGCPTSGNVILGTIGVPASAGNAQTVPPINLFGSNYLGAPGLLPRDMNGQPYLFLPTGWSLTVADTSSTAAKTVGFTPIGQRY